MSSPVSALLTGSPQPKASFHLVFIAGSLLFFAVFFVGMGAVISPLYPGPAATTTGTIVSSPTSWPVVAYTVDGVAYEVKTKENDPSRQVGQQLTMLYNPGHPTQASTVSSRRVTQAFAGVAFACLAGGAVLFVRAFRARARARWAVVHGTRFQATITGVSQNPMVHIGSRVLTRLTCTWTAPGGTPCTFRTLGGYARNGLTVADLPATTLPLYLDPDHPDERYFLDDSGLDLGSIQPATGR